MFCPPGRFSIRTTWPHCFVKRSASSLARISGLDPGGCDRTTRTVFDGQACASAGNVARDNNRHETNLSILISKLVRAAERVVPRQVGHVRDAVVAVDE